MNSTSSPIISPVLDFLQHLHGELAGIMEGEVATYIPELAKADPRWFGICLVTASGSVYEVGDTGLPFTIQSISKPFVYGLALEDNGLKAVLEKVGVEPTGDAFNSISLEPSSGRPRNPMINAGAIATAGLILGPTPASRQKRILDALSLYAGRDLTIDEAVYRSESETGHRNRAIGHMLRNFGILTTPPEPTVELYFHQCSVSVTCRDLGIMAGTLANRGVNPVTGKQAIRGEFVENMLSVMSSCGMYDWAGEWVYNVGMPAKSGVAGGIVAVLPGQLGVAVYSPALDSHGNSVRGIRVCEAISRRCDLHMLSRRSAGTGAIRLQFTSAQVSSRKVRSPEQVAVLQKHGSATHVYQLQGNLTFVTTEAVAHEVMEKMEVTERLVLDFGHVLSINDTAARMIYELTLKFDSLGKAVLFTHPERVKLLRRVFKVKIRERSDELFRAFDDNDAALEWCEEQVLAAHHAPTTGGIWECELFEGLTKGEIDIVARILKARTYQEGEAIVRLGDAAQELFVLVSGRVSVFAGAESGTKRRLATFSPGMIFGEVALIDNAPRSAPIVADTMVECLLLTLADFQTLGETHPAIKIKLLENISRRLCRKLRKANRELSVFD